MSDMQLAVFDPIQAVANLKARHDAIKEVIAHVMIENEHFGAIPGVKKNSLYKAGAELLCSLFQLADPDGYEIVEQIVDFDRPIPMFYYMARCKLYHTPSMRVVGSGLGSCNSMEEKYYYREAKRVCPQCGTAAIIKGKAEYGGGWLCFAKKGGCGAKFGDNDPAIVNQPIGRVINDLLPDLANTVLKQACKRAYVAATLTATGASAYLTQDVEDMPSTLFGGQESHSADEAERSSAAKSGDNRKLGELSQPYGTELNTGKTLNIFFTAISKMGLKPQEVKKDIEARSGKALSEMTHGEALEWALPLKQDAKGTPPEAPDDATAIGEDDSEYAF